MDLSILLAVAPPVLLVGFLGYVIRPRVSIREIRTGVPWSLAETLKTTRSVKAAAATEGFFQIAGRVEPTSTLRTPIWGTECVAYRVEILVPGIGASVAVNRSGATGRVMSVGHDEAAAVPFDVVDDTGRVRVEADSQLHWAVERCRETQRSFVYRLPREATAYLDRALGAHSGRVILRERWLSPGERCSVVGQLRPATAAAPASMSHGAQRMVMGD